MNRKPKKKKSAKRKPRRPTHTSPYYFDEDAADRACNFFERYVRHTKGRWAGESFVLLPWQRDKIIRPLFGWKCADGTRKFRYAYIEVPRKNGKSTLAAGIALYMLFADKESGAEVYSAAADKDQARIVFDDARRMVEKSPQLNDRAEVLRNVIVQGGSTYKVLSSDAPTKHGLNPHAIIFDELHAQPNRDLYDVLVSSMGARTQPLMVMMTTAGYDRNSVCFEQHEYARKILEGIIDDPRYFAFIAAASETADWQSAEVWRKANPSLGHTITEEYISEWARRAMQLPSYQNTFRRLHLNQWTQQHTRWLDIARWDACAKPIDLESLRGQICYAGLDLASTKDIAALVLVFKDKDGMLDILPKFFVPSENAIERSKTDHVPYDVWIRDGYMTATEGNVIDFFAIRLAIQQLAETYGLKEIAIDRWNSSQLSIDLQGDGFTVIPFGQGFASMSGPSKELERLILAEKIRHGGNPVLRWMADNVALKTDPAGNIKPDKEKSTEKIDGIVAMIMALDRAIRHESSDAKSVYEDRGLLIL